MIDMASIRTGRLHRPKPGKYYPLKRIQIELLPLGKKFGGKTYQYYRTFSDKTLAIRAEKFLRDEGYYVRVQKSKPANKVGYTVWARKRK